MKGDGITADDLAGDGLIVWSNGRATCGLVVKAGTVVAAPPYLYRSAMGRKALWIWLEAERVGNDVTWVPTRTDP